MSTSQALSLRLGKYMRNHVTQWIFLASLVAVACSWLLLAWFIRPSEVPVLLRYNVYLNFDLNSLVPWYKVFSIPLMATIFLMINAIIAFLLFRREDSWASHIVLVGGFCVQLVGIVSVVAIILGNR